MAIARERVVVELEQFIGARDETVKGFKGGYLEP